MNSFLAWYKDKGLNLFLNMHALITVFFGDFFSKNHYDWFYSREGSGSVYFTAAMFFFGLLLFLIAGQRSPNPIENNQKTLLSVMYWIVSAVVWLIVIM